LGTWHLLLQFVGFLYLLYCLLFQRFPVNYEGILEQNVSNDQRALFNPESHHQPSNDRSSGFIFNIRVKEAMSKEAYFENQCFVLLVTTLTIIVTSMMVQGAWKGRSAYLLPYFCMQIFDFVISCLTVAGFFSYDDVRQFVTDQVNNKYLLDSLDSVSTRYMITIFIVMAALILTLKAYCICLVWACYKYLCEQERSRAGVNVSSYQYSAPVVLSASGGNDAEILLPPKYEDVIKSQQQQQSLDVVIVPPAYSND